MVKYLGKEFKNHEELRAWTKAGKIKEYKRLAERFSNNPSMEHNVMMCKLADVLMGQFDMSPVEIEALELEAIA